VWTFSSCQCCFITCEFLCSYLFLFQLGYFLWIPVFLTPFSLAVLSLFKLLLFYLLYCILAVNSYRLLAFCITFTRLSIYFLPQLQKLVVPLLKISERVVWRISFLLNFSEIASSTPFPYRNLQKTENFMQLRSCFKKKKWNWVLKFL
jgi:hypothetical protein